MTRRQNPVPRKVLAFLLKIATSYAMRQQANRAWLRCGLWYHPWGTMGCHVRRFARTLTHCWSWVSSLASETTHAFLAIRIRARQLCRQPKAWWLN